MLYNGRGIVLNFYNEYTKIASETKCKSIHGEVFKILTPKQIFRRLPIALTQLKASNTSQNLLNEIRQTTYFLHRTN